MAPVVFNGVRGWLDERTSSVTFGGRMYRTVCEYAEAVKHGGFPSDERCRRPRASTVRRFDYTRIREAMESLNSEELAHAAKTLRRSPSLAGSCNGREVPDSSAAAPEV